MVLRVFRRAPPHQDSDDAQRAQRIEPERRRQSQHADDDAGERRPDGAADVDADAVERDRRLQVLVRHQGGHDGLPRGRNQRGPRADEEREDQQDLRRDPAEPYEKPEHSHDDGERAVDGDQQLAPVDDVGERAGGQSQQHHRQHGGHQHQRDDEGILRQASHQPASRRILHPRPDVRDDGCDPQRAERGMAERIERRALGRSRRRVVGSCNHGSLANAAGGPCTPSSSAVDLISWPASVRSAHRA